jgi:predicted oxidoreductase (fatty acid repression mutant protein)
VLNVRVEDHAKATADKIDGVFKAGYGTVLFFSETAIVDGWGNQMPPYAEVSERPFYNSFLSPL